MAMWGGTTLRCVTTSRRRSGVKLQADPRAGNNIRSRKRSRVFSFSSRVSGQMFPCRTWCSTSCSPSFSPHSVPHNLDSESGLSPKRQVWRSISTQPLSNPTLCVIQHPRALQPCDALTWSLCWALQPGLPESEGGGKWCRLRGHYSWGPVLPRVQDSPQLPHPISQFQESSDRARGASWRYCHHQWASRFHHAPGPVRQTWGTILGSGGSGSPLSPEGGQGEIMWF